jgi:hypothetical protein
VLLNSLAAASARAESPACLTFDDSDTHRPSAVRGLVIRGQGSVRPVDSHASELRLTPERISFWDGYRSATTTPFTVAS